MDSLLGSVKSTTEIDGGVVYEIVMVEKLSQSVRLVL